MILDEAEPLEVGILKKQLANLTCKCSVCEKAYVSGSYTDVSKGSNKEIQVGPVLNFSEQNFKDDNKFNPNFELLCNQVSCPGCYIALHLLKSRETKICKDEETETTLRISCCDKASGKRVKFKEQTTSTTSIICPPKHSYTSLCEKVTNTTMNGIMKKRSNDHVTFSDLFDHDKQEVQMFYGHCLCLQNFIDSIRPPLEDL